MAPYSDRLVLLLHGVAAFGHDLDPLARVLRRALPGAEVIAPDAPLACVPGPGRQWYDLDAVTPANRPERIEATRGACDGVIEGLIARHGFADRPERVALVGFSQGATIVFDGFASGRWRAKAVVLLSGRFVKPQPFAPAKETPVLLVHGAADGAVPPDEDAKAERWLAEAGVRVERHLLPGVGHVVSPKAARLAARFLKVELLS
ncbi:phospholipase [Labrys miyagiensis]|uniref:Phospholipase n=1 Tax=Labrys miyagiensis TaxID=346912 RepID=A0ABQ6CPU2_9HYPH|nr:dienelactone hydrolase family protein [Labrys miyagiensis]GLS20714.1 phospholipase [Labrys miyagiensis]